MAAPVVVVGFNRPEHLRLTLHHLERCQGFGERATTIVMDGPRSTADDLAVEQARGVASEFAGRHRTVRIVLRPANLRFRNLVDGVTEACRESGEVIVIEDDVLVSPDFLKFMDQALERYRGDERVWAVSGNVVPKLERPSDECFFLPVATTSGWATWWRAWKHFDLQPPGMSTLLGDADALRAFTVHPGSFFAETLRRVVQDPAFAWDPQWHFIMHTNGRLSVQPPVSLTWNCGMGTGTNFAFGAGGPDTKAVLRFVQDKGGPAVVNQPRLVRQVQFPEPQLAPADMARLRSHYRALRIEVALKYAMFHPGRFVSRVWAHGRWSR